MPKAQELWKHQKYFYYWSLFKSPEWWKQVKIAAINSGISLGAYITRAIEHELERGE